MAKSLFSNKVYWRDKHLGWCWECQICRKGGSSCVDNSVAWNSLIYHMKRRHTTEASYENLAGTYT